MTIEFVGGPMDGDVAALTGVPLNGEYIVPLDKPATAMGFRDGALPSSSPPPLRIGVYRLQPSTRGRLRPVLRWQGER